MALLLILGESKEYLFGEDKQDLEYRTTYQEALRYRWEILARPRQLCYRDLPKPKPGFLMDL
jgi:hypothetical protein